MDKENFGNDETTGQSKAFNRKGIKGETDHVLSLIDQEQLKADSTERSDFDAYKEVDDLPKDFARLDKVADYDRAKGDAQPIVPQSMERFCFVHDIDEKAIRENKGMKLNQKVDSPADDSKSE